MATTILATEGRPDFVAGRWYQPVLGLMQAGAALTQNSIRLVPFMLLKPMTVSALGARITTLSVGGNVDLAIYADAGGVPAGLPLAAAGSLSTTTATVVSANLGANAALPRGLYWMAVNADNSTVACQVVHVGTALASYFVGSSTLTDISSQAAVAGIVWTIAQTFGTWPDLTAASLTKAAGSQASAAVFLKAA